MPKIPRFRPALSIQSALSILSKALFESPDKPDLSVRRFEAAFAEYIGVRNSICVPSGRMGLYLILKNLGLGHPGEIIMPAFTYWAIPRIVSHLKFKPVFVDIEPQTCNIDARRIEERITQHTKVIIPTHLYGRPCRMDKVLAIASKYNMFVIEDCVQACGARFQGRKVGSLGDASYFGFGITKNMPILGGGVVATNNDSLAAKIRTEIASYGFVNKGHICKKGLSALVLGILSHRGIFPAFTFWLIYASSRSGKDTAGKAFEEQKASLKELPNSYFKLMPGTFFAEGLTQLKRLDRLNTDRIRNASHLLEDLKGLDIIRLPEGPSESAENIFTNFPIRSNARGTLSKELLKRGIDTSSGYMKAHCANCLNAVTLEKEILHLPIYPSLSRQELSQIGFALREISKQVSA